MPGGKSSNAARVSHCAVLAHARQHTDVRDAWNGRYAMPYEQVVLTDGTAVLFAVPDDPQEPETLEAEPLQRDPTRCLAASAPGKARRWQGAA